MFLALVQVELSENCCFIVSRHGAHVAPAQAWEALSAHPSVSFYGVTTPEKRGCLSVEGNVYWHVPSKQQIFMAGYYLAMFFVQIKITGNWIATEINRPCVCVCRHALDSTAECMGEFSKGN